MTTGIPATDPGRLLGRLPGWETADWTPLGHGSNNAVFLLRRDEQSAVLKVARRARGFPLNTRAEEARAQRQAQVAGLAPRVLYADDDLLLEEYVELPACTASDLRSPALLRRLAAALQRLHALPPTGRRFPLQAAARHYRERLLPGADEAAAERCLSRIAAVDQDRPVCCCHNDLVAGNILAGERLCLLDWEYAADNDPLFDLAILVRHHDVGPAGTRVLLAAYFGAHWRVHAADLRRMGEAYAALAWLWAASRP